MGRHARGAFRSRVLARSVVLVIGAGAVVAVGLGLGSGAQSVGATASAVVVSSLACHDGAAGTVVDVLAPTPTSGGGPVRADLDACGYREGQQLQVQFVPDDPTQVVLAGNESATDFLTGDGLPFGLGIAAVLAVGAALAIWVDARRANGWSSAAQSALVRLPRSGRPTGEDGLVPRSGRHALPELPEIVGIDRVDSPDPSVSTVDLTFPYSSSLAACLHDELFTHRSRVG
jgi:hypothetical protein